MGCLALGKKPSAGILCGLALQPSVGWECNYVFHYDDVIKLPKRSNSKTIGYYPKLTVKGHPAKLEDHWFKTIDEAQLHILDLAAYIFEEELRIAAA